MSPRAGLDQEAVLDAAEAIASANGLDNLTLAALAAELGVRSPSLYNHVDGIVGVRRGLRLKGLRIMSEELRRASVGVAGDEALYAVCSTYRRFAPIHPAFYSAIQASVRLPDADDKLRSANEEVLTILLRVLRWYGLEGDEGLHAVRVLRSGLHGFVSLEIEGAFGVDIDVDESFARLVYVLAHGLRIWHAPERS